MFCMICLYRMRVLKSVNGTNNFIFVKIIAFWILACKLDVIQLKECKKKKKKKHKLHSTAGTVLQRTAARL